MVGAGFEMRYVYHRREDKLRLVSARKLEGTNPDHHSRESAGGRVRRLVMCFEFPTMLILSTIDVSRGERSERRSTTKAAATGQARLGVSCAARFRVSA